MDGHLTQALSRRLSSPTSTRRQRICILAPHRSGANAFLASQLREVGHEVTLTAPERLGPSSFPLGGSAALADSYRVYHWLKQRSFDTVWFADHGAPGYYSLLARHQGLAFAATRFGLLIEGPTLWRLDAEGGFLDDLDRLECDAVERRCIELADGVSFTDPAVHPWMEDRGWPSPRRCLDDLSSLPDVKAGAPPRPFPLVSVCLVHHDRPALLLQALASLEAQDYPHFEIVLVDDGSRTPAAHETLARLEPLFLAHGWPLVRQANRYLGAARNTAVRHARGDYLLFMDDDNLARPHELSTLVRAAGRSGADVLTTFMDFFEGDRPPASEIPLCRWLFAGTDSLVGVARNCYGDANALVRRCVFDNLGGFTEEQGVTHEDWEFFARAVLRGYRLEVVPEALFWYRQTPGSMVRSTPPARNYARSLRPFLEEVPPAYRDLLRLTQGLALSNLRLRECGEKPLRYRLADFLYSLVPAAFRRKR